MSWQWLWYHDKDYDVMTIMIYWFIQSMPMAMIMMSWQWLWYNDNDFDAMMTMIMTSWQ